MKICACRGDVRDVLALRRLLGASSATMMPSAQTMPRRCRRSDPDAHTALPGLPVIDISPAPHAPGRSDRSPALRIGPILTWPKPEMLPKDDLRIDLLEVLVIDPEPLLHDSGRKIIDLTTVGLPSSPGAGMRETFLGWFKLRVMGRACCGGGSESRDLRAALPSAPPFRERRRRSIFMHGAPVGELAQRRSARERTWGQFDDL